MNVLVACEESGAVRDAFAKAGHFAMSVDLLPSATPGHHYQGDIRDVLDAANGGFWDIMLAFPPCTRLTNSGVRWLHERNLWSELDEAVEFFLLLLDAKIPRKAIENPIQHKHARARIRKYDQIIQPWMFGHPETKATCLWLENLPPLVPTNDVRDVMRALPKKERNRIHYMSPGDDRSRERSATYAGIAQAMADQWGNL